MKGLNCLPDSWETLRIHQGSMQVQHDHMLSQGHHSLSCTHTQWTPWGAYISVHSIRHCYRTRRRAVRMSAERACDQRRRPDPDTLGAKWGVFWCRMRYKSHLGADRPPSPSCGAASIQLGHRCHASTSSLRFRAAPARDFSAAVQIPKAKICPPGLMNLARYTANSVLVVTDSQDQDSLSMYERSLRA